ncbi:hypothetical protein KNP414_02791 [Paenibacillus mucilaginosus KNP414]|uniref:Uncharacterized protein n=1 Tax=Paenibacillus mucilaginosus (strain KNP414) TaxID=1036673 RepID=F8FAV0_PAEMK|nr:hypothetical protein KNP414_02791 [Paenibacillus mucilaginosus KNP414]
MEFLEQARKQYGTGEPEEHFISYAYFFLSGCRPNCAIQRCSSIRLSAASTYA